MSNTGERPPGNFEGRTQEYMGILYRTALRLTGSPEDAEDLVQETYLKAFRAFDTLEQEAPIKPWLFTILTNTYRDHLRKGLYAPRPVIDEEADPERFPASIEGSPEEEVVKGEARALIRKALETLPPEYRMAVILTDLEGFSYREVAGILNCPVGTVMSRLYRGRRLLKRKLLRYAEALCYVVWEPKEAPAEGNVIDLREYRERRSGVEE